MGRMWDALLDKSVVGYTALGYRWRPHPPIAVDLSGRVAIVTGATSGLGKSAATELARLGATTVLVGRNPEKTAKVCEDIQRETGNANVRGELADLSSMSQVRALAERIEHLERLRQLQDETSGFTAFICWTFQPEMGGTNFLRIEEAASGSLIEIVQFISEPTGMHIRSGNRVRIAAPGSQL